MVHPERERDTDQEAEGYARPQYMGNNARFLQLDAEESVGLDENHAVD